MHLFIPRRVALAAVIGAVSVATVGCGSNTNRNTTSTSAHSMDGMSGVTTTHTAAGSPASSHAMGGSATPGMTALTAGAMAPAPPLRA